MGPGWGRGADDICLGAVLRARHEVGMSVQYVHEESLKVGLILIIKVIIFRC